MTDTRETARQKGYVFINRIKGNGPGDFKIPVASTIPNSADNKGYSTLFQINYVKWNNNYTPRILKPVSEIMDTQNKGELDITKTNNVVNSPFVRIKFFK